MAVGPQTTISCPLGAVDIWPGTSIPLVVNLHDGMTTFCLRAGVHAVNSSITPKTGNTFVGEYGAILDGTGWTTTNDTDAAFRAYDGDISYVTIRNLVIRNMRRAIQASNVMSSNWTIEHNEIGPNYSGVVFPSSSVVKNNYIHDNSWGGYVGVSAHNSLLENNEIARNGWEQKIALSTNVTFRDNFVHHNVGAGIWYDSDNTGALVEGNRVEDNAWIGIFYEISSDGIIRNNTIRRNAEAGVMLSVSKNVQIHNNTLEDNFRGITFYLSCPSLGGPTNFDLTNNTAYDNAITVGTQVGAFASVFSHGSCTSAEVAPYLSGSKNLTFLRNTYEVPSVSEGQYWLWNGLNHWGQWQSLGHDVEGAAR